MPPKRSPISEASTMSQAAIRKLIADSVAATLKTQTSTMVEADNPITNTRPREIPVAKRGNYKEFISCQPFYFNGTKGVVGLIRWFKRTESNMEDEIYNLSVKGNDLKTYVKRFQELVVLCPNMVPNNEKLMEVFISGLPRSIKGNVTASKPQTLEEAINIAQRKEKLFAKFSKCDFWIRTVQFLGHLIDSHGLYVDPAKIETVNNWASPTTPTEIRQFLGLASYYRRFIKDFSKIAKSLTILTQKDKKFVWGEDQEMAF
nr:putative reverse transcriptase domain-containing protein [Tanacetum cinerariifolium]